MPDFAYKSVLYKKECIPPVVKEMGAMSHFGFKILLLKIDEIYTFYCLFIVESNRIV